MKFFRFHHGHTELERKLWIRLGVYAESRLKARSILVKVLFESQLSDGEKPDPNVTWEYFDERELYEGEEPVNVIYDWIPDGNGEYKEMPDTTINF
jgi:hypothetical protein